MRSESPWRTRIAGSVFALACITCASAATADSARATSTPEIAIWYGDHQKFGQRGTPQRWLNILGNMPDLAIQVMLAVLATVFTLVMSNVGATTILVPIAISIALATGANPVMYALIIALSTSNAFILPTHQVNALIMGPGGYSVADFVRAGTGMSVVFLVVMLTMVNLVF